MSEKADSSKAALPAVEIYTDGGCEPNPGPGGFGAVLLHPKKRLEVSGGFRKTTNNRMEIYAAIKGLELLKQPCQVVVYSDSQYVVESMMKGWAANWKKKNWRLSSKEWAKNIDLWDKLLSLCATHQVEFRWVKGHAGTVENERCDQLSSEAIRRPDLPIDEGYEDSAAVLEKLPEFDEGQPCPKCATPVVRRKGRWKPKRDYYYEYHLFCPKCEAIFHVEGAKRFVAQSGTLF
jgi:ribonuclease HI